MDRFHAAGEAVLGGRYPLGGTVGVFRKDSRRRQTAYDADFVLPEGKGLFSRGNSSGGIALSANGSGSGKLMKVSQNTIRKNNFQSKYAGFLRVSYIPRLQ